ncbi:MAG: hypothetical protein FWG28_05320 [Clostridiales bacterium]|nr:hypothetical protein [Clostridiales bacterium]
MKQHFIVQAIMTVHPKDCLVPVGAVCTREELHGVLKTQNVKGYKMKSIDDEPVADWEKADWVMI